MQLKQVDEMMNPRKLSNQESKSMETNAAREQLFEGSSLKPQTQNEEIRSSTATTMATMAEARDQLVERGEKLGRLDDKSAKLADASREFANMAKQLREQQQKQSWW